MKDKNQNKATKSEGSADEKATLNRDFQKMSHSRMLFSGLGNLVLLVICFWIHWSLGALFFLMTRLFSMTSVVIKRVRTTHQMDGSLGMIGTSGNLQNQKKRYQRRQTLMRKADQKRGPNQALKLRRLMRHQEIQNQISAIKRY